MNQRNKDYKPLNEYMADLAKKKAVAATIAKHVHALTVRDDVDIDLLVEALHHGLLSTKKAAEGLGLSTRAFLRLRRKYGLRPVARPWLSRSAHMRYCMYSLEQLKLIPAPEVAKAKRRALVGQRVARAGKRRGRARVRSEAAAV